MGAGHFGPNRDRSSGDYRVRRHNTPPRRPSAAIALEPSAWTGALRPTVAVKTRVGKGLGV